MDLDLTDEQQLIAETARDFTDNEIVPRARESDRAAKFDAELARRLGERGASHRGLVDGVRCDLAKHYLADTDLRLQQVAYLLGYSEPAPLVRAFKRWAGCTPIQYRTRQR